MKKTAILVSVFLGLLVFAGCGNAGGSPAEPDTREAEGEYTDSYRKVLDYMVSEYGLTMEELEGVDVEAFAEDYRLYELKYEPEEIREILKDQKEYYKKEPEKDAFSILGDTDDIPEGGPGLPNDADIMQIGYYANAGTLQRRAVFNLEEKKCYTDNMDPFDLSEEQVATLKDMPKKAGISSWEHRYEKADLPETTGSFCWKMVFILRDGTQCIYGGYTTDMTDFPDGYDVADTTIKAAAGM